MPAIDQYVSFSDHDIAANAASDTRYYGQAMTGTWRIVRAQFTPGTSVAVHATDYCDITLKKGSTTLATLSTNSSTGQAFTAGTPIALTISGAGTDLEFAQGSAYNLVLDASPGAGAAIDGRFEVVFEKVAR